MRAVCHTAQRTFPPAVAFTFGHSCADLRRHVLIGADTPRTPLCHPYPRFAQSTTCSASSLSGDKARASPDKGYAFLHDFCLGIPYGVSVLGLGVAAWVTSSPAVGAALASAGVLSLVFQGLSLKCFNVSKKSAPFTIATAGVSVAAAVFSWQNYQKGITQIPSVIAVFLSAALAAFLVYNVAAGGNPPKGEKPLEGAAPHPTS